MKRNLFYAFTLLMSTTLFAQNENAFTGYYRASGPTHLLIEEDHRFYIIAYSTFIQGHWSRENDQIKLVPQNPEYPFEIYGRYNPNIKEGYKIKFTDFYKKQTFIATSGIATMQRIFNPNPNCFNYPYIHHFDGKAESIVFVDDAGPDYSKRNTYTFMAAEYNDFVALYHDPSDYQHEIILQIEKKAGQTLLKNTSGQFDKGKIDEKLQREIVEIKEMAKQERPADVLYCNPSYRPFEITSMNVEMNYTFDSAKNAWVSKYNYEKDEEIYPERKEDAYHSIGIIYKYVRITPANVSLKQFNINEKSLFTAKCNDLD